jgi:Domain of unknown function (DUF1814).
MTRITIAPRDEAEHSLWRLTLEVADLFDGIEWTVAGAQMVALLEREAGITSGRTTGDIDAVVGGPRAVVATRAAAERLRAAGFERSVEHPQRYQRGPDQVDLLTVDHLRAEADDLTTVPGGRRAVSTSRRISVEVAGVGERALPVPSVAGAIAMKLQSWAARRALRDLEDLVRLLGIVEDVDVVRLELKAAERRALGRLAALDNPAAAAWRATRSSENARAALARLRDG